MLGGGGGGLPLNIFLGLIFFCVGLRYFQAVYNFRGLKNFWEGLRNFFFGGGGCEIFRGGG